MDCPVFPRTKLRLPQAAAGDFTTHNPPPLKEEQGKEI